MNDSIVIIGAGQAGGQAVQSLKLNKEFTGSITLIGDEAYVPYQRPPLSKKFLAGEIGIDRVEVKPQSYYEESGVDLRLNTQVESINREAKKVILEGGEEIAYDKLLLATGARVRKVPIPGANLPEVFYLRSIDDVDKIRPYLKEGVNFGIVGGGYIGLEVAAVAATHGANVTVLEMADRVMARQVSPELSAFYEKEHREHGVDLRTDMGVTSIEGQDHVTGLKCGDGSTVKADLVIVGVGVVPNVELAEACGLETDNGIVVDECGRTQDENIFSSGDCTNHPSEWWGGRTRLESVQNALDQTKCVISTMLGSPKPYKDIPWFWSDQYDLKLQIAGLAGRHDTTVLRGDPENRSFAVFYLTSDTLTAVEGVNAIPEFMMGRRLITQHAKVDPDRLADTAIPMKEIVPN